MTLMSSMSVSPTPPDKQCNDCHQVLPATAFWRKAASPDGLAPYCKPCFKQHNTDAARRRAAREGVDYTPRVPRQALPPDHKHCPACNEAKPLDAFGRNRSAHDGLTTYCKPCHNETGRRNRERLHGSTRHYHLKRRYGLGADEVAAMIAAQFNVCPICINPSPNHVDHDHGTGRVRAVLCFNCNGGLGQFKDQPDLLRRAADYLEGNVWKPTLVAPGVYRLPS